MPVEMVLHFQQQWKAAVPLDYERVCDSRQRAGGELHVDYRTAHANHDSVGLSVCTGLLRHGDRSSQDCSGGLTVRTGRGDSRTTRSATLPSSRRLTPVRPCVAITTESAPARSISRRIAAAGSPTWVRTSNLTLPWRCSRASSASLSRASTSINE